MSLKRRDQEEIFVGTHQLDDLLEPNDPMVIFSREIYPVFKDEDFKDFYSTKGRGAISPAFLALVTILQFKENLSDLETAEACVRRLDWKIALHLPIEKKDSFDASTLCYFRRRLKEHKQTSLIFDKMLEVVLRKGFIKKKSKQRIDATHIIKHIHRISTTDLVFRSVRCLAEEVEKKYPDFYENEVPIHIKERYEGSFSSFGLSKAKRADKQAEIVEDGIILREILETAKLKNLDQLTIMNTVIEENIIIHRKTVGEREFIETEEIQSPKQTIFDPRDPTIKLGIKGKISWVGEKCHVVETAEKDGPNFIVGMLQQGVRENDSLIHDDYRKHNEIHGLTPEKIYVDSGYISGAEMQLYQSHHCNLMGYVTVDSNKRHPGFYLQDFEVDLAKGTARCPAGQESNKGSYEKNKRFQIRFKKSVCLACSFKTQCLGTTEAKIGRKLNISPYHGAISQRRKDQRTSEFKKEMSIRAQIEGTISEAVRSHGLRRIKYKYKPGRKLQYLLTGAAINLKRLLKLLSNLETAIV